MATFYVICAANGDYIAAGRIVRYTQSLCYAKHFTSLWSATCFIKRECCGSGWSIKKIVLQ